MGKRVYRLFSAVFAVVYLTMLASPVATAAQVNYSQGQAGSYTPDAAVPPFQPATDTAAASLVPVGKDPWGLSLSDQGKYVCVSNNGSNSISVINSRTDSVTATMATGAGPTAIIGFSNKVATLNSGDNSITIADISTGQSLTKPLSYFTGLVQPYVSQKLAGSLPAAFLALLGRGLPPQLLPLLANGSITSPSQLAESFLSHLAASGQQNVLPGSLQNLSSGSPAGVLSQGLSLSGVSIPAPGALNSSSHNDVASNINVGKILNELIAYPPIMAKVKSKLATVSDPSTGQTFTIDNSNNQVIITGNIQSVQGNSTNSNPIISLAPTVIKLLIGSAKVMVNGQSSNMPVAPVIINNRTEVPLRFISQSLGAAVHWNPATQGITITSDSEVIEMKVGQDRYTVNGVDKTMDQPPVIVDGTTMVPLRFVAQALGAQISTDFSNFLHRKITVTKTNKASAKFTVDAAGKISTMIDGLKVYTDPANSLALATMPAQERESVYAGLKHQIEGFKNTEPAFSQQPTASPQTNGKTIAENTGGQGPGADPRTGDPPGNDPGQTRNIITVFGGDGQPFTLLDPYTEEDNIPHYTVNYGLGSYTVWSGTATHGYDWNSQGAGTQILADAGIAASRSDLWMTADYKTAGSPKTTYPVTVYYYDWIQPIQFDITAIGAATTEARIETSDLTGNHYQTVHASSDIAIPSFGSDTDVSEVTETTEAAQDVADTADNSALDSIWSKLVQVGENAASHADDLQTIQGYISQVATALGTGYTEHSLTSSVQMPGGETLPFSVGTAAICGESGVGTNVDWVNSYSLVVVDQQVPVGTSALAPSSQSLPNSYNVTVNAGNPAYTTKPIGIDVSLASGSLSRDAGIQLVGEKGMTAPSAFSIPLTAVGKGEWHAVFTPETAGRYTNLTSSPGKPGYAYSDSAMYSFFVIDAYGQKFSDYQFSTANPGNISPQGIAYVTVQRLPVGITSFSITPNPFAIGNTLKGIVTLSVPVSEGKVVVYLSFSHKEIPGMPVPGSPPPPDEPFVVASGKPVNGVFQFTVSLDDGTLAQGGIYQANYMGDDTYAASWSPPLWTASVGVNMQPLPDTFVATPVSSNTEQVKETVPVGNVPGEIFIAEATPPPGPAPDNRPGLKYTPVASWPGGTWEGQVEGSPGTSKKIIRVTWQWYDTANGRYYTQFVTYHPVYFGLPTLKGLNLSAQDIAGLTEHFLNLLGLPVGST